MTAPPVQVVAGVLADSDGRLLLVRRGAAMTPAGCWEVPGGKVEPGESLEEALSRELLEELELRVEPGNVLFSDTLAVNECVLEIHFIEGRIALESTPCLGEHDALLWVLPEQVAALELAPGDIGFAAAMGRAVSSR